MYLGGTSIWHLELTLAIEESDYLTEQRGFYISTIPNVLTYKKVINHEICIYFCVTNRRKSETSIKTGTRRVTRLDDMLFEMRLERRIMKSSSSGRVTRLVPVFILETDNRTNYKMFDEARPDG